MGNWFAKFFGVKKCCCHHGEDCCQEKVAESTNQVENNQPVKMAEEGAHQAGSEVKEGVEVSGAETDSLEVEDNK